MDKEIAQNVAQGMQSQSVVVSQAAQAAIITNDVEYDQAAHLLLNIKERAKVVDAKRKEFTQPLYDLQRKINAFFKKPLDDYKQAELALKAAMAGYHNKKEEERRKALQAAKEAADKQEKATFVQAMEKAADNITPEAKGTHTREVVRFEVVDPALVPREFCSPDEKKIKAAIDNTGEHAKIAGVRIWKETVVIAHGIRGKK